MGPTLPLAHLSSVGVPVEPDTGAAAAATLASVDYLGAQGVEDGEKDTARGQKRAWQSDAAAGAPPYPFVPISLFGTLIIDMTGAVSDS